MRGGTLIEAKDTDRALRATFWPVLKSHGFTDRTGRVAWRYRREDIDVVELQAVGQLAEAVGCPPLSLSVFAASFPPFLERTARIPVRNDRLRPHYWHCHPFSRSLSKNLSQPWFRPFSESRDKRQLPSFRLHRQALEQLIDRTALDRPEIWYMHDDGSNLDENIHDLTSAVLSEGLPLLDEFHDPRRVLELIEEGSLLVPASPHAYSLKRSIETYLAES